MNPKFHFNIDDAEPEFAPDLSWIIGTLEWVELEGGFWRLHFGNAADPHGGEVTLSGDTALNRPLTDGSRVRARGRVLPDAIGISMSGNLYEVDEIASIVTTATTEDSRL